jgi:hypothetical protein
MTGEIDHQLVERAAIDLRGDDIKDVIDSHGRRPVRKHNCFEAFASKPIADLLRARRGSTEGGEMAYSVYTDYDRSADSSLLAE